MMDASRPSSAGTILSLFSTPLTAVGASGANGPNAQISVSTYGAGVVPDQPRLITILYKANLTRELVEASGSFSVSVLSQSQINLIERLGFVSGRDGGKLEGLGFRMTARGNPVFEGCIGWLECEVIESFDLGDGTAFLGAVLEHQRLSEEPGMYWSSLMPQLPEELQQRWNEKISRDIERYRTMMHWRA